MLALGAGVVDRQDDGTRAPLGISPTDMTLAVLKTSYARALGSPMPAAYVEHWSLSQDGMTGAFTVTRAGDDVRSDLVLGDKLRTANGFIGGRAWEQNPSGEITYPVGVHRRDGIEAATLATMGNGVALLGVRREPHADYVLRVDPPTGFLEYAYIDASTFLLDRVDQARRGSRVIYTYDDYRSVGGHMVAHHVHTLISKTGRETDRTLQSVDLATPIPQNALAIPATTNPLAAPQAATELPVHILSDRIVLTAHIKGRAVNLFLDSGAAGILIDPGIMRTLGIPMFGGTTGTMAGEYSLSRSIVPEIDFGSVALRNVMVNAIPFTQWADAHTPVAGLAGFDLLDGAVFKIDYVNGTVTILDPATFTPPANAFAQPIALDDYVPMISASIAHAAATHLVLDTGADRSALYSAFVSAHALSGEDQGLGTEIRDAFPFEMQFYGVGGRVAFHPLQLGPFTVAGETFPSWLFTSTYNAASFEDEDYDGLVGQDVLRYFDVYFDYPHQRVYFVPNARYTARFG